MAVLSEVYLGDFLREDLGEMGLFGHCTLLLNTLKCLGFILNLTVRRPQDQHTILTNADEVYAALGRTAP